MNFEAIQGQDPHYFGSLYDTYGEKIFNLAYRMSGNREDAADITQDTFLQVFRNIESFRGESGIYTWIYAIALNQCRQFYKRRKKSSFISIEELMREAGEMKTESALPDLDKQILIGQVKEGCLTGLLGCLPFNQRTAFILHVLLEFQMRDVSAILHKTEGAAKVLVYRARARLKEFLCKNCSVYDIQNPCRCENLLAFSLKQGWISLDKGRAVSTRLDAIRIEDEIKQIRKEIELYRSLDVLERPEALNLRIRSMIESGDWSIFRAK